MRLLRLALISAFALLRASFPADAAEFYSEDLRIPFAAAGPQGLEAFLVRPAAPGRYPLALISHGSPRNFGDRATMSAHNSYPMALEFARRGFASLIVMRHGYGTSPGGNADDYGSCDHAAYPAAVKVAVADLRAAIEAMKKRDDVSLQGMIAVGHSAGGLATVGLAAQAPPGLAAALNFAGGRGSDSDNHVCNENGLVQTFGELGKTSRIPMLWVYAANDMFFWPALAHRFYDAFRASGGRATLIDAPPYGLNGHFLFSGDGRAQWTPLVDVFLRDHGLGRRDLLSEPDALPAPGQPSAAGSDAFTRFLSRNPHKAFVVSARGGFGWRSGRPSVADAQREALTECAKWAEDCRVYAVDDRLVRGE